MARDEPGFAHEPGLTLIRAFEREGDLVEQIEREGGGGGFLWQALQYEQGTMLGGKHVQALKRVRRRAFQEHEGVGFERLARHGVRRTAAGAEGPERAARAGSCRRRR